MVPEHTRRRRAVRAAAWPLAWVTLALTVAGLVLAVINGAPVWSVSHLLFVAACAVAGALILAQRPHNPVGALLATGAFAFAAMEACGQYAIHGGPLARAAAWPQTWLWVPANLAICLVPLYFPTGALPGRRWRPVVLAVAGFGVAAAAVQALAPGPNAQVGPPPGQPNPLGVAALADVAAVTNLAVGLVGGGVFVAASAALVRRARRGPAAERLQLKWLGYGCFLAALVVCARLVAGLTDNRPGAPWPAPDTPWELAGAAAVSLLPVAVCVAVLRHGLFDIDLLINRTAVYATATGLIAAAYVGVVSYLGALLGEAGSLPVAALAAVVVAIGFAPVRSAVQRLVNRLMYGERGDPYEVLTRLGRTLAAARAPGELLAAVADTLAETLRLRYVRVETADGDAYAHGVAVGEPWRVALTSQGETVGSLAVWPAPQRQRDERLLADLAPQLGAAVHAVASAARTARLAEQVQQSRERLVVAREEERRRLRRDLHDGLGPTLAALSMRAEVVGDLVADPAARRLVEEIIADSGAAVADLRRLIDGLRPPALDTLGLVDALRSHVMSWPDGAPRPTVHATGELSGLPAATEVAAYRIAVEALANARRHAGAATIGLRMAHVDGWLTVEVRDDGTGLPGEPRGVVGIGSMRERAAELGGTCSIASTPGRGTTVTARLPTGEV
ncbi:histidine kinase [Luedemannella helvata]|uniref:histidine kinase n=1 Tax=Luedemannella helvata TaxID=349315 RepID=A0ABP4X191_9ACTN